jgi:hypothetical protein
MSGMSCVGEFNAVIYVSEQLTDKLKDMAEDFAKRCVHECAKKYNFDANEAIDSLGFSMVKMEKKRVNKVEKVSVVKPLFPLPYSGGLNEEWCFALRQNKGLYTQCTNARGTSDFCKGCANTMQKAGSEVPEYGTIQARNAVGIFNYVDPKGRRPTPYLKVMKKYKMTNEEVLEEARKLNIVIDLCHFTVLEDTKRGRPSKDKEEKIKGAKGRPKKSKKVIQIAGDDDDLFDALVAKAKEDEMNVKEEDDVDVDVDVEEEADKEAEAAKEAEKKAAKEAAKAAKDAEKAAKEAAKAAKDAEKAAKDAEKAAKETAKEVEKAAKEAQKAADKAAKEAQKEAEKAAKDAEKKAAKDAEKKVTKEAEKKVTKEATAPVEEDDDNKPDIVKVLKFGGKSYLKSKKTNIVYDYIKYTEDGEQVVIGKYNVETKTIDFIETDEEDEDEYDV